MFINLFSRILPWILMLLMPFASQAAVGFISPTGNEHPGSARSFTETLSRMSVDDLATVTRTAFKNKLGRKLKVRELITFKVLRSQARKARKKMNASAEEGAKADGFAITSLVVGIVSIFFAGIILGVVAVVFGLIALNRIRKDPERRNGKGFAIAGIATGAVGLVGALIILLA
jgi:hypothetical protein